MAMTNRTGTAGSNFMWSGGSDDLLMGMGGEDQLIDGGRYGQDDPDSFEGGAGNDVIYSHWGVDQLSGGAGDDLLISRSDAGRTRDRPESRPAQGLSRRAAHQHR